MKGLHVIALAALCVAGASCDKKHDNDDPSNRRPKAAIAVLVDTSKTWHNDASRQLNTRILNAVGDAVANAANQLRPPISVRYHAIGEASLGKEAVCATDFRPSMFNVGKPDPHVITDKEKFRRYVAVDCPAMILSRPPARSTEIAATVISAERAMSLTRKNIPRVFIILSDFKEESVTSYSFRGMDFHGSRFILLYRTLDEDRLNPAEQQRKLRMWKARLEHLGANVAAHDENAPLSSPRDFEEMIRTVSQ